MGQQQSLGAAKPVTEEDAFEEDCGPRLDAPRRLPPPPPSRGFTGSIRDACVLSSFPQSFLYTIGSEAEKADPSVSFEGAMFDLKRQAWFLNALVAAGVCGVTPGYEFTTSTGLVFAIPPGYRATEDFKLCPTYMKIGLYDDRTSGLDANFQFKVQLKDDNFSANTKAGIRRLLEKGNGQVTYEYFVPCLAISTTAVMAPQAYSWVHGVVLGATVTGDMNIEDLDDDSFEAGFDLGGALVGEGRDFANLGANFNHIDSGKMLCGVFSQDGGVALTPSAWADTPLAQLFQHLDKEWKKKTLQAPKTWTIQKVAVREAMSDELVQQKAMALRPHIVAIGHMGVGKSKFLTAFASGKQKGYGQYLFRSGVDPAGMRSVTHQIQTEIVNIDYHHGTAPTMLTDVPGFGDPSRWKDEETVQSLLSWVMQPSSGRQNIHAIVLVEKFGTTRFAESHLKFLRAMENQFGDEMWNHLAIVLTHFQLIDDDSGKSIAATQGAYTRSVNNSKAEALVEKRKLAWRIELHNWFPGSMRALGRNKNFLFCLDSNALMMDVEAQECVLPNGGRGMQEVVDPLTKWYHEFSEQQLQHFRLFLQARAQGNQFLRIFHEPSPQSFPMPECKTTLSQASTCGNSDTSSDGQPRRPAGQSIPPLQPVGPGASPPLQPVGPGAFPPLQPVGPGADSRQFPGNYPGAFPPLQPVGPGACPPLQPVGPGTPRYQGTPAAPAPGWQQQLVQQLQCHQQHGFAPPTQPPFVHGPMYQQGAAPWAQAGNRSLGR